MNRDDLQSNIENIERELADLKTVQGVIKSALGYSISYTHSALDQSQVLNQQLKVHFATGDGPILCSCSGSGFDTAFKIVNNAQIYYFRMLYDQQKITFYSNREILSVELLT